MTRFIQQQKIKKLQKQTLKQVPKAPCPDCNKTTKNDSRTRRKKT